MILSHIVATSENRVIGKSGELPWHIPEDLKFFKEKTNGHILIMGRKTFESIKKPLPNRFHIVITRNSNYQYDHPMVSVVSSLKDAYAQSDKLTDKYGKEIFIVGGGEIYKQSLPDIHRIYLTLIHEKITGDTFYPDIDFSNYTQMRSDRSEFPVPHTYKTFHL